MNRHLFSLLTFLAIGLAPIAQATPLPISSAQITPENILVNPGFENGTYGWTASGGATKTANSTAKLQGSYGYDWDSNSASQTLLQSVTIPGYLKGQNGYAFCQIKTVSGTATHTLTVDDGSTDLVTAQTIASSTSYAPKTGVNFIFPTSGSVRLKMTSVASNEPELYIDSCYLGAASNLSQVGQSTPWQSYSSTVSGLGTGSGTLNTSEWRRVGDSLELNIKFTKDGSGGSGSSDVTFSLPSGLSIDTNKVQNDPNQVIGSGHFINTGYQSGEVVVESTTTVGFTKTGGSTRFQGADVVAGARISFVADVPISGWQDGSAVRADTTPASWSGYQDAVAGGCATTSSTYADPSACTSVATTQVTARNITCSQASSSAPGITCTLPGAGLYKVKAKPNLSATAALTGSIRLTDGSGTIIDRGTSQYIGTSGKSASVSLSGDYLATGAGSVTFKVQLATDTSTLAIANGTATNSAAIQWEVLQEDAPLPSPILTGFVGSNTSGQERVERAKLTNGGGSACTVTAQSGSWMSTSGTRNSDGNCSYTITTGIFSGTPVCTCSTAGVSANVCGVAPSSATSVVVYTNLYNGTATDDSSDQLICMGPH